MSACGLTDGAKKRRAGGAAEGGGIAPAGSVGSESAGSVGSAAVAVSIGGERLAEAGRADVAECGSAEALAPSRSYLSRVMSRGAGSAADKRANSKVSFGGLTHRARLPTASSSAQSPLTARGTACAPPQVSFGGRDDEAPNLSVVPTASCAASSAISSEGSLSRSHEPRLDV